MKHILVYFIEVIIATFFIALGLIPFVILVIPKLNSISPMLSFLISAIVCLMIGLLLYKGIFVKLSHK